MRRTIFLSRRLASTLTVGTTTTTSHWSITVPPILSIATEAVGSDEKTWTGHVMRMLHGAGMMASAIAIGAWGSTSADSTELSQENRFSKWWESLTFASPESRKRTFFKYEKRIRSLSTPEKIFEYFSSVEKDGIKYMTAVDLLRALVPVYPPEGSEMIRGGALLGERIPRMELTTFFKIFDMDGDNLISFYEYLMVLTFLSIPLRHIEVVFDIVDVDNNGVVDKAEFELVLNHIKKQSRQTNLSRGGLRTGLKAGEESEDAGLLLKFFGEDGKGKLRLPEFKAFLEDLQQKLLMLEFVHYDFDNKQTIGGKDFARSLCAAIDISLIDQYLTKVSHTVVSIAIITTKQIQIDAILDRSLSNIQKTNENILQLKMMQPVLKDSSEILKASCLMVDDMDAKLAKYEITKEEFLAFYSVVNLIHVVETALNFIESTDGHVSPERFGSTLSKLAGTPLRPSIMEIIFWLFSDEQERLKTKDFMNALRSRHRKQNPDM